MRPIVALPFVTLEGVMQAPGGRPHKDKGRAPVSGNPPS
jgi:hypothetical protein